jgi:ligand-binding sensor domain-containing protein
VDLHRWRGLNKFNSVRNCFETYRNVKKDNNSISSNVVRVFYEDDAGNYWIGNFNAPLNYIDTHKKKFNLIRFSDEDEIEQGINNIISVLRDKEETLWIGTDGNGLLIVNENGDVIRKFRHIEGNINSIANNKPLCLEEDDRGNIWIGTFEGGLSCFNPHSNRFTNFYPDGTTKNPRGTQIWDLLFDHGKLWIASERGVDVLNTSTMIFNPVPIDKKKGTGTNVAGSWKIVKDSKNRILIGTIFGLNVFDPQRIGFITMNLT